MIMPILDSCCGEKTRAPMCQLMVFSKIFGFTNWKSKGLEFPSCQQILGRPAYGAVRQPNGRIFQAVTKPTVFPTATTLGHNHTRRTPRKSWTWGALSRFSKRGYSSNSSDWRIRSGQSQRHDGDR